MSDSHFTSNIEAAVDDATITIAGFNEISATTITDGTTTLSGGTGTFTTITDGTMSSTAGAVSGVTTLGMGGALTGATSIRATNYVQVGDTYIFSGAVNANSASIVAAASAVVTTASLKGSLFMNASNGVLWTLTATMTATSVAVN